MVEAQGGGAVGRAPHRAVKSLLHGAQGGTGGEGVPAAGGERSEFRRPASTEAAMRVDVSSMANEATASWRGGQAGTDMLLQKMVNRSAMETAAAAVEGLTARHLRRWTARRWAAGSVEVAGPGTTKAREGVSYSILLTGQMNWVERGVASCCCS